MSQLSIFVDESGDFGAYKAHSPFYIFTLVFHDQSYSISEQLSKLEQRVAELGFERSHCFHAGPIIRREEDYTALNITDRRKCMNAIISFAKSCNISYISFFAEKKHIDDSLKLAVTLSKQLSAFIRSNYTFFQSFDKVTVYYDNGQVELNKILASVFSALLSEVEFRKVIPAQYRLFQVADLLCTLELISLKMDNNLLSASEEQFFGSTRDLKKNYLKPMAKIRFVKWTE